jgi:hypothetical protein
MKRLILVFALTALAACDTEKHQLMEDCMMRVQADSGPSVTARDIKQACKELVKSHSSPQSPPG